VYLDVVDVPLGLCTYRVEVQVKVMRWQQRGGIENLLSRCTLGLVT